MSSNIVTKRMIYATLKNMPGVHDSGNGQLRVRCIFCGDSATNINKKRLGIKMNLNDPDAPIVYNCFNGGCGASGVVTPSMLHKLEVYEKDLDIRLRKLNNSVLKDDGTRINKYKNTRELQIVFPPITNKPSTINKIKYLFTRLGCRLSIEEFEKLKIVLDLGEFLAINKIEPINEFVGTLSKDYVGFLSVNNEYVILRDITDTHKMRYVKYNLFGILDNTNGFYAIKNSVDILGTDDIYISIAEGPFDVLGLYCNVFNRDIKNNIVIASCNASFLEPIKYYMKKGVVGSNVKINCYQDNDTKLNFGKIRDELKTFIGGTKNFSVYYNTLSKDFGVPKSEICVDKINIGRYKKT